jgi:hypothetical protein
MATSRATTKGPQPLSAQIANQKVTDLGFSANQLKRVPARVKRLTVADLRDFARVMEGNKVDNKLVASLTATDIKGIEDLFSVYRSQALDSLGRSGASLSRISDLSISISCCCTTPCCCCCGAADINPFES